MELAHGGAMPTSAAAIVEPLAPSASSDQWLDLLQVSRSALLRRAPTQITAITVSGQLRDVSDLQRLLLGCALVSEEYDLKEQLHLERGYCRVRISRA